jgi:hypothetical protein
MTKAQVLDDLIGHLPITRKDHRKRHAVNNALAGLAFEFFELGALKPFLEPELPSPEELIELAKAVRRGRARYLEILGVKE